ncbi:MAG: glycosyltransferase [Patescibacteria group bacterium]|jgi:glycosyltransferase involved in cell wall biosynthesis
MKIAQIVCTYPPYAGGIGNSAKQFTELLEKSHEVTNFHPESIKPLIKVGHGAFIPALYKKLSKFDAIFLHYPFFGTAEIIWLFKRFHPQRKLIIYYHMDVLGLKPLTRLLSLPSLLIRPWLLKQADQIVCSSLDYIKNSQIKDIYNKYPDKFKEIPFGVDTKVFCPNHPHDQNLKTILFVGGLDQAHYFKGVDNLIRACAKLASHNWQLIIGGEGNLKEGYQALAEELKIGEKTFFPGKLSSHKLVEAFQSASVLVLPSINSNEAFGIVLVEALSCGTPVIASNLPGVRSVFENRKQGFVIEPNNVNDLAEKLEIILQDNDLREMMRLRARELAEEKYDLEITEKSLNQLFN